MPGGGGAWIMTGYRAPDAVVLPIAGLGNDFVFSYQIFSHKFPVKRDN